MPKRLIPALLLLPLSSCHNIDLAAAPPSPGSAGASVSDHSERGATLAPRKLVRSGAQAVKVHDLQVALSETGTIVKANKGYVETSTVRAGDEAELHLRVPPEHLPATLDAIARLGRETHRHLEVNEVTRQYVDLEAELANLRALRGRLRTLLNEAQNVKDALRVEKELTRVQTRIDALHSQLLTLRNKIAYSRIALTLERKRTPGPLGFAGKAVALGVKKLFVLN